MQNLYDEAMSLAVVAFVLIANMLGMTIGDGE